MAAPLSPMDILYSYMEPLGVLVVADEGRKVEAASHHHGPFTPLRASGLRGYLIFQGHCPGQVRAYSSCDRLVLQRLSLESSAGYEPLQ